MKTFVLKELVPYTLDELSSTISVDEKKLKVILDALIALKIVKSISNGTSKSDLEALSFDLEELEELISMRNSDVYIFNYVGIISVLNISFVVYPKYENNYLEDTKNHYKKFRQIISVIRKYNFKSQNHSYGEVDEKSNSNILPIILELISDYKEYGIYSNVKDVVELNGNGEIMWGKTINELNAYLVDERPIYLDYYTQNKENDDSNYFARLHSSILTSACKNIESILDILGLDSIMISNEDLDNFGSKDYIIHKINQEYSNQYITYKQNTLDLMRLYITNENNNLFTDKVSFVGTTSFNLVWEDVCSVVKNNCIDKSLRQLGLDYSEFDNYRARLSDVISKPKWKHTESNKEHSVAKTLEPDIITVDKVKESLNIYDAKYYRISLDENGVKNQPGVGDVTKQYLYELSYKKFAKENNLCISENAFLMPTDGCETKKIGSVSMDMFRMSLDNELNDIDIVLLPCEEVYRKYLEKN